jgi:glycosyltransferase involved in cell wall biosynthesis
MMTDPTVSIVIPTYNRCARLGEVLEALARQTVSRSDFEVVVVSDGSTDRTDDYLRDVDVPYSMVVLRQANAGPASARNAGATRARGRVLLFVDDDVVARPQLVEEHIRAHEKHGDLAVVIGPMLTPPDCRLPAVVRWEQAMLYKQYEAMRRGVYSPTYRQFYTGNASLHRSLFLVVGGFDERLRRAEDVELAYRLGQHGACFVFNERAEAYHYAQRSFDAWLRNAYEYASVDVLMAREAKPANRLAILRGEFYGRNALIRRMSRACAGREWVQPLLKEPLRVIANGAELFHLEELTMSALSALYNVVYYCGLAAELGGRSKFLQFLERATPEGMQDV